MFDPYYQSDERFDRRRRVKPNSRRKRRRQQQEEALTRRTYCCTKHRYRDREQAKDQLRFAAFARSVSDGHEYHRNEIRYYFCGHCRGWHLTSQPLRDLGAA
jgi:hypothetical protein